MLSIAEKISTLRAQRGLTLEEVGAIVGVGKSTVRKWEKGLIKNMRRDKIALLAKALGVTPAYLLNWDDGSEFPWTTLFIEVCEAALSSADPADLEDSGISASEIEARLATPNALSFEEGCEIASMLGVTLGEDFFCDNIEEPAPKSEPEREEFGQLFTSLNHENRKLALDMMRVLLARQLQPDAPQE